ncbi:MAG: hypothetical protein LAO79_00245, partial [Acidobacteriia bacterium]|nr:hypothetical protein [Terriglobia bacterium]
EILRVIASLPSFVWARSLLPQMAVEKNTRAHAGDAIVNAIVNLPPDQLSARTTYEGSLFLAVDPLRESFGRAPPSLVFSN